MTSVASQLIEEVTAHVQSDSLEDAREIRADGTYFPNKLRNMPNSTVMICRFIDHPTLIKIIKQNEKTVAVICTAVNNWNSLLMLYIWNMIHIEVEVGTAFP